MNENDLLSTILDSGITSIDENTQEIRLRDSFQQTVLDNKKTIETSNFKEYQENLLGLGLTEEDLAQLQNLSEIDTEFVSIYLSLAESTTELNSDELTRLSILLQQLPDLPPQSGTPNAFIQVPASQLELLLALKKKSIVYIWRNECESCELMKEDLNELFPKPIEELGLYAIYGPNWAEQLQDHYAVMGGPATLFFINNQVNSRLYGAHRKSKLKKEVEIFRDI